jgi:hypothetical protein
MRSVRDAVIAAVAAAVAEVVRNWRREVVIIS